MHRLLNTAQALLEPLYMFYKDKMNDSYLYRNKQVIQPEWLLKPIISNPLRWAMDLPSLNWKFFRQDNSLQSESDPAELKNLLAWDSDEK